MTIAAQDGRTFNEIESHRKGRSLGCPRCDADKNAGSITVQVRALGPKGSVGRNLKSRSVSLCEPCCVEVFHILRDDLLGEVGA